jgi:hypothetical protein
MTTQTEAKDEKNQRDASRFSITVEDFRVLRSKVRRFRISLGEFSPPLDSGQLRSKSKEELGIYPTELRELERALADDQPVSDKAREAKDRVIKRCRIGAKDSLDPVSDDDTNTTVEAKPPETPDKPPVKRPVKGRGPRNSAGGTGSVFEPPTGNRLGPNSKVFITPRGQCVHLLGNCSGIEAFGASGRKVKEVRLKDRRCAGRKYCTKCTQHREDSYRKSGNQLISELHPSASAPPLPPPVIITFPQGEEATKVLSEKLKKEALEAASAARPKGSKPKG